MLREYVDQVKSFRPRCAKFGILTVMVILTSRANPTYPSSEINFCSMPDCKRIVRTTGRLFSYAELDRNRFGSQHRRLKLTHLVPSEYHCSSSHGLSALLGQVVRISTPFSSTSIVFIWLFLLVSYRPSRSLEGEGEIEINAIRPTKEPSAVKQYWVSQ